MCQWVQTLHPHFSHAGTQQSVPLTHMSQLLWKLHEKTAGLVFTFVLDISWEGRNMSVTYPQPKFTEQHIYRVFHDLWALL